MVRITFTTVKTDYDLKKDRWSRQEIKDGLSIPSDLLAQAIIGTHLNHKGTGLYYTIEFQAADLSHWHRYQVKKNPLQALTKSPDLATEAGKKEVK